MSEALEAAKREQAAFAERLAAIAPWPTPLERAQLAAPFLAKWVDAAEPANDRVAKRVEKALAMADLLWAAAHAPPSKPDGWQKLVDKLPEVAP